MLMLLCILWTCAINAVQQSDLTTADLSSPMSIERGRTESIGTCLGKYNLIIGVGNESIAMDLKEVEQIKVMELELEGQKVICVLAEDEAAVRYVDDAIGAEAIVISNVHRGMLLRRMVLRFLCEGKTYVMEPHSESFLRCDSDGEGGEPLDHFLILGETHYLYEVDEDFVDPTTEEMVTTTEEGPVDPPKPPIFIIVVIVCGILFSLFFCFCRCCFCCCRFAYNSM